MSNQSHPVSIPETSYRAVGDLVPYARNARTHSDEQIDEIAASLIEFGWTYPVLADAEGIVAGHGRVMAATRLYEAGKELRHMNGAPIPRGMVPVMDCTGWSPAKRRAYILADNKIAANAGWDEELLKLELGELKEEGFDLGVIGFSDKDLEGLGLDGDGGDPPDPTKSLAERFGLVPFSVLNAREGWWQDRKAAWLALGIESDLGRGENLLKFSDTINQPDPAKRKGKRKGAPMSQDLMSGEGQIELARGETKRGQEVRRHFAQPGRRVQDPNSETPLAYAKRVYKEGR